MRGDEKSRGRKRQTIAQDLGVHRTTVQLWLQHYHARGIEGLQIQWAPGQPRRIPETLVPTIQAWVKAGPAGCGLDRAHWTYEGLATYVYQTTGIAVKRTAMWDFCQHYDMRPYRPTYRYLRGDPEEQRVARDELEALKKSPSWGLRGAEPRRSPLSTGADVTGHAGREGLSPHRGDLG
jgi:transposase